MWRRFFKHVLVHWSISVALIAFGCFGFCCAVVSAQSTLSGIVSMPLNSSSVSTDTMPSFPGGEAAMQKYLSEQLTFPESVKGKNIQGTVVVSFMVSDEGKLLSASVITSVHPDLDAEALRVVNAMPQWKPAIMNGKPVRRLVILPVSFLHVQVEEKPLQTAEVMPVFPGDSKGLTKFLRETLWYPEDAKAKLIQGLVLVTFVVEKDGSATHPQILRSLSPSCDQEAIRVVGMMPKWTPGLQDGKQVRVQMNLPLRFSVP